MIWIKWMDRNTPLPENHHHHTAWRDRGRRLQGCPGRHVRPSRRTRRPCLW